MERSTLAAWRQAVPLMAEGYHTELLKKVEARRREAVIYPPQGRVLAALRLTSFDAVKVVIVGQDPYHGEGQADGLAFSVPEGGKVPPSLRNIFKVVEADIYDGVPQNFSTDLSRWAEQGVLLLNASLTVREGEARSHCSLGWMALTDQIIAQLSEKREHRVFMLWGNFAKAKAGLIDDSRHRILMAPHPSPLSAYRGFFDCRHFSKANAYLKAHGCTPIVW